MISRRTCIGERNQLRFYNTIRYTCLDFGQRRGQMELQLQINEPS